MEIEPHARQAAALRGPRDALDRLLGLHKLCLGLALVDVDLALDLPDLGHDV